MKINKKSEKGDFTLNDYMLAISIFVIGTYVVVFMYQQIYKMSAKVKIDEAVIGYVTEICEQIDLVTYDEVSTKEEVDDLIKDVIKNTPIESKINDTTDTFNIVCTDVEKYSKQQTEIEKLEKDENYDYVEKIHIRVSYTSLDNIKRDYYIRKIKVKEL